MPTPDKTMAEHRQDGTWPEMRFIDVLPGDRRGGRVVELLDAPDGGVLAGVVFPDGHVEVHPVDDPDGLLKERVGGDTT